MLSSLPPPYLLQTLTGWPVLTSSASSSPLSLKRSGCFTPGHHSANPNSLVTSHPIAAVLKTFALSSPCLISRLQDIKIVTFAFYDHTLPGLPPTSGHSFLVSFVIQLLVNMCTPKAFSPTSFSSSTHSRQEIFFAGWLP